MTYFVLSESALRQKYGVRAAAVLTAVHLLGKTLDVSGKTPVAVQAAIADLPAPAAVCLIGGYDVMPPFVLHNPAHGTADDDATIPTDAPFGAHPDQRTETYAPRRAVSRIPDSATPDADSFLSILGYQADAPKTATPHGSYEEAASEFAGALKFVRKSIPNASGPLHLSPPNDEQADGLTARITQRGRIHVLLHGANSDPDWATLWGNDGSPHGRWIRALSAQLFGLCDLRGAIVTFSSCYAGMLDAAPAHSGARTPANQVALACLTHGSKAVFGATRSNWIATQAPFDAFGPALVAATWRQLAAGATAAEALRLAKREYLKTALAGSPKDRPYALKTVLQAHCYGHPAATL
jgi:hypothetical protein